MSNHFAFRLPWPQLDKLNLSRNNTYKKGALSFKVKKCNNLNVF